MVVKTMIFFHLTARKKLTLRVAGQLRPDYRYQFAVTPSEHIIAPFLLSKNRSGVTQSKLQPFQRAIQPPPSA